MTQRMASEDKMRFKGSLVWVACAVGAAALTVAAAHELPALLSAPTSSLYHEDASEQWVPLADGVELAASLFLPSGAGPFPVVVVRTAYGRDSYSIFAEELSQNGIAALVVDVRGRYDSEGEYEPLVNDGADGQAVLSWAVAQSWCNGRIVTFGGSHDAWIQMLTACRGAPELSAMVLAVLPGDPFANAPFGNGAYHPPFITWAAQNEGNSVLPMSIDSSLYSVFASYPLHRWDELLERPVRWLDEWLDNWELNEYWSRRSYEPGFGRIGVPTQLTTGWFDLNQPGGIRTFQALRHHSDPLVRETTKLIVGPWAHTLAYLPTHGELTFPENAWVDVGSLWHDFIEDHALGDAGRSGAAVDYYLMGRNEWLSADDWPPEYSRQVELFMTPEEGLRRHAPDAAVARYLYNPGDPTPIVDPLPNEPWLAFGHYPHDVSGLMQRDDVLVFTTETLATSLAIAGPVTTVYTFSSTAQDTDMAAMLLDLTPDGRAITITHGLARARFRAGFASPRPLTPGEVSTLEVDMWSTAYEFAPGHRIGLLVSSAQFPAYDAHRNLYDDMASGTQWQPATQTIHMGTAEGSRLRVYTLPDLRRPTARVGP